MRSGQSPKPSWNEFKEEMNYTTGGVIPKDKEPIDISHTDYCDISAEGKEKKDGA